MEDDDPLAGDAFSAVELVVIGSLLVICLCVNRTAERRGWPVPPALLTTGIGLCFGGLMVVYPVVSKGTILKLENAAASEFMIIWLAPIIFAEGYALKSKEFFDNIYRILALAFVGTTISTVVVGTAIFYLPWAVGLDSYYHLSPAESLAFGALLSSTDPVTTLAIFKEQRMTERGLGYLYYTVLGESILNDAVAIVLYTSASSMVLNGQRTLTIDDCFGMFRGFVVTFFTSLCIGVGSGLFTALVLKVAALKDVEDDEEEQGDESSEHFDINVAECSVAFALACMPYLIAEALDLSPIVAVMFAGITDRLYAHYNLSTRTRKIFLPMVELIASLCETYIFIVLGLSAVMLTSDFCPLFMLFTLLACFVGRVVNVYPLCCITNCLTKAQPVRPRDQHMIWCAGLRGGMAFICAMGFPQNGSEQHRTFVLVTTSFIIATTMVGIGWPTASIMAALHLTEGLDSSMLRLVSTDSERDKDREDSKGSISGLRFNRKELDKQIADFLMTQNAKNALTNDDSHHNPRRRRRRQTNPDPEHVRPRAGSADLGQIRTDESMLDASREREGSFESDSQLSSEAPPSSPDAAMMWGQSSFGATSDTTPAGEPDGEQPGEQVAHLPLRPRPPVPQEGALSLPRGRNHRYRLSLSPAHLLPDTTATTAPGAGNDNAEVSDEMRSGKSGLSAIDEMRSTTSPKTAIDEMRSMRVADDELRATNAADAELRSIEILKEAVRRSPAIKKAIDDEALRLSKALKEKRGEEERMEILKDAVSRAGRFEQDITNEAVRLSQKLAGNMPGTARVISTRSSNGVGSPGTSPSFLRANSGIVPERKLHKGPRQSPVGVIRDDGRLLAPLLSSRGKASESKAADTTVPNPSLLPTTRRNRFSRLM